MCKNSLLQAQCRHLFATKLVQKSENVYYLLTTNTPPCIQVTITAHVALRDVINYDGLSLKLVSSKFRPEILQGRSGKSPAIAASLVHEDKYIWRIRAN